MTARVRLPRLLADSANLELAHEASGTTVSAVLEDLFRQHPVLRGHLLDETGALRPHLLLFVDAERAELDTVTADGAELRVLQAVSGG